MKLRAWVASVKELPQNMGVPVVRDLNIKGLQKAEGKRKPIEVERSDAPEPQTSQPE